MSEIKCRRCGQFIEKRRDGIWVTSEWPIGLPYCGSVPHPPHESAEPSPAPPTERVIDVAPQGEILDEIARFNVVDLSHRRMVQENHGLYVKWIDHVAALKAVREERDGALRGVEMISAVLAQVTEERDRAHAALREAKEFIENQQLPNGEWSRVLDIIVAALKPVSDRQPEGETK